MSLLAVTSGDIASGVVEAEGVDFDGVSDYLSRSTDLVGNVDSKTFTFSCWVYLGSLTTPFDVVTFYTTTNTFNIVFDSGSNKNLQILGRNSVGTIILFASVSLNNPSWNTFHNIQVSIDLNNTTNRSVYIDNIVQPITLNTYTNDIIDFTTTNKFIGKNGATSYAKGRLSHVFLDYQYRDLSIEANRRLFITADGKPTPTATLKALNPILYLPMKDAATAHINEGTGGNFTANGTFATSNRGANQDNCVASYFDGAADYLSRTSLTGIADGKQFTFSCTIRNTTGGYFFNCDDGTYNGFRLSLSSSGWLDILLFDSTASVIFNGGVGLGIPSGKTAIISASIDMDASVKTKVIVDGVQKTLTTSVFVSGGVIDFTKSNYLICKRNTALSYYGGNIGELYFDTKYIDLATSNPFWDSVENKPIPVRKAMATLGSSPLICMPLDASNAGKNYGTGGDFTANSAPYVGARGASEYISRSVKSDLVAGSNLRNTSNLGGVADGKTFSGVAIAKHNDWTFPLVTFNGATENITIALSITGAIYSKEAGTSNYNLIMSPSGFVKNKWNVLFFSVDLTDTNKTFAIMNSTTTTTKSTFVNSNIGFSETTVSYVGKSSTDAIQGENAFVYFTTDYIDFSQEVNRLKFVDGLGYPLDLSKQIDKGLIPKPLIYLPFNDPSNLGKNLGTGGNFTVNGTVTAGADFSL